MNSLEDLKERKKELLDKIRTLKDMRQGSIVEQYFENKGKDGSVVRQGPYLLYSYKVKGKTISRRLSGVSMAERYQEEINEYRRFEELCSELVETSHKICDLKEKESDDSREKKRRKPSSRKSGGKSKG